MKTIEILFFKHKIQKLLCVSYSTNNGFDKCTEEDTTSLVWVISARSRDGTREVEQKSLVGAWSSMSTTSIYTVNLKCKFVIRRMLHDTCNPNRIMFKISVTNRMLNMFSFHTRYHKYKRQVRFSGAKMFGRVQIWPLWKTTREIEKQKHYQCRTVDDNVSIMMS